MSSTLQERAVQLLAEAWELSPDVRLGQLFAHLGFLAECHLGKGLGYVDDDELIAIMQRHKAELLARLEGSTEDTDGSADAGVSVSGSPTSRRAAS
jgi:hypothetical protein